MAKNGARGPRGAQRADGERAGEETAAATTMASKGESCFQTRVRPGSETLGRITGCETETRAGPGCGGSGLSAVAGLLLGGLRRPHSLREPRGLFTEELLTCSSGLTRLLCL